MSFESLDGILGTLEAQNRWQEQPFPQLLRAWSEAVGEVVAAHTRPLSLQRQVLWVATSSAVWAQELTFGRQRIIVKLNAQLSIPLQDIRFSPAQWQQSRLDRSEVQKQNNQRLRQHPSHLAQPQRLQHRQTEKPSHPKAAFQNWAQAIKVRSQGLPLCPQCRCPTPPGELQRWQLCALCVVKQW